MKSLKPYLIRALYEWIVDSNLTPYFLVDATHPDTTVPENQVNDGKIILNLAPNAVFHLEMDNTFIQFYARFSGVKTDIKFSPSAVMAIYAKENGKGMIFDPEPNVPETEAVQDDKPTPPIRPKLTIVK